MDIYDFLNTFTDLSAVVITVFDCISERVLFNSAEDNDYDPIFTLQGMELDGYEVEGVDLFKNRDGMIQMEINISLDGED